MRRNGMSYFTNTDGTQIYYKDWGSGVPIVLCHGWPLSSDAWDAQMLFLAEAGFRVVAYDRRGHGRSSQPWEGNNYDTFADDLNQLIIKLDLKNVSLAGHSMGGGDVARYIGKFGTSRLKGAVLISSVAPTMLKSETYPNALPMSTFDSIRAGIIADRSQFFQDFAIPFFNANRPNSKVSKGTLESFWNLGMQGSIKSQLDCTKQFSETDFTEDLKKFDLPTLIIHGDDDQIVPIEITGKIAAQIVKGSIFKVYPGGAHGLCVTESAQVNKDLLEFLNS